MRTAFYNGFIFTGSNEIPGKVIVEGNTIISTTDGPADVTIDLHGDVLAPAFIDLQIYGGNNQLFGEHPSVSSLIATVDYSVAGGATLILPTVATNSQEIMNAAVEAVREYWKKGYTGVAGLHLEGPFINPEKRGAHIPGFIKSPTLQDAEELMRTGKGVIKMMTLAPEVCPPEVISYLQQNGVIISAGHTNATYEQALAGNVNLATHLFNAMSPMQHRAAGMVGAILFSEHTRATVIADGNHVDYHVIAIAKKIMGERLLLITDAVTTNTSGLYQHQLQGDKYVMPDGTLSGSALTMLKAVRNCIEAVGISREEALRMASLYPAQVLQLDHKRGRIKEGYDAELVRFDNNYQLKSVYTNGSLTNMP